MNGGTVVAMRGDQCVTVACDLRLGEKMLTISTDKTKVYKMGDRVYLGVAGLATDAQTLVQRLTFRKNLYELRECRTAKPPVLANMLSNLLYEKRFGPYFSEPLIAGLDPENFTPYICNMDHIGCISNPEDFVAVGTGGLQLYGICEAVWEKNMDSDALFEATGQALLSALDRDALSGWGAVVWTITKDKVTMKSLKARLD